MQLLHYDPEEDPFALVNDPAVLDNTPLGTLRVIGVGATAYVCLMKKHDPTVADRPLFILSGTVNPLDAVYGKRYHEGAAVERLYQARNLQEAQHRERDDDGRSVDWREDMARVIDGDHQQGLEAFDLLFVRDGDDEPIQ